METSADVGVATVAALDAVEEEGDPMEETADAAAAFAEIEAAAFVEAVASAVTVAEEDSVVIEVEDSVADAVEQRVPKCSGKHLQTPEKSSADYVLIVAAIFPSLTQRLRSAKMPWSRVTYLPLWHLLH